MYYIEFQAIILSLMGNLDSTFIFCNRYSLTDDDVRRRGETPCGVYCECQSGCECPPVAFPERTMRYEVQHMQDRAAHGLLGVPTSLSYSLLVKHGGTKDCFAESFIIITIKYVS